MRTSQYGCDVFSSANTRLSTGAAPSTRGTSCAPPRPLHQPGICCHTASTTHKHTHTNTCNGLVIYMAGPHSLSATCMTSLLAIPPSSAISASPHTPSPPLSPHLSSSNTPCKRPHQALIFLGAFQSHHAAFDKEGSAIPSLKIFASRFCML